LLVIKITNWLINKITILIKIAKKAKISKASYPKLNSKLKFNLLINFKKEKLQKLIS